MSAQCSEDLGFLFEGHGNPWGLCTEDGQDLTKGDCQMAGKLGAGGWKVRPVRESGETRKSQGGSQGWGREGREVACLILDPVWEGEPWIWHVL